MEVSLKKYLISALKWFAAFLFIIVLCIAVCFIDTIDKELFFAIIIPISCIVLLLPAGYYTTMFFVFKKKCRNFTPVEGVITNWETGFYRYSGSVIVEIDGKEYSTSSYFSHEECKELVGKMISYAIINETLFIYDFKN